MIPDYFWGIISVLIPATTAIVALYYHGRRDDRARITELEKRVSWLENKYRIMVNYATSLRQQISDPLPWPTEFEREYNDRNQ